MQPVNWKIVSVILLVPAIMAGVFQLRSASCAGNETEAHASRRLRAHEGDREEADQMKGRSASAELARELFADAARADPEAALKEALELKGARRRGMLIATALILAETAPDRAAIVLRDEIEPCPELEAAWPVLVHLWAERSPQEAAAFVQNFSSPIRSTLVVPLISAWPEHQREDAARWLESLPQDGFRRLAESAYRDRLNSGG